MAHKFKVGDRVAIFPEREPHITGTIRWDLPEDMCVVDIWDGKSSIPTCYNTYLGDQAFQDRYGAYAISYIVAWKGNLGFE